MCSATCTISVHCTSVLTFWKKKYNYTVSLDQKLIIHAFIRCLLHFDVMLRFYEIKLRKKSVTLVFSIFIQRKKVNYIYIIWWQSTPVAFASRRKGVSAGRAPFSLPSALGVSACFRAGSGPPAVGAPLHQSRGLSTWSVHATCYFPQSCL